MWIAEKFQSNSDIAGSLRNSFRASVNWTLPQVELLYWVGGESLPNHNKLRMADNDDWQSDCGR